jgi:GNAT superfamily N-acetyltransferase
VATTGAKEPWQMTRGEFINKRGANAPMESDNFAIHHLSSVEDGKPGLSVEGDKIIVRNEAGSPIGVTTLKTIGGQKVTDSTAVHPGNRRQGVATQLYAKAKELGYDTGYVENVASAGAKHKLAVQQALSEGKSVPPEVLADYPDLAPTAPAPDATKLNSLLQQEQTPGEKALAGAKGTKKAPLTAGRREHLARQLNEEAAREEAALDPELFKAEHGYPAEMASPADIAKFRAAKKGGLKGLTVEEVNWVMADAAEKGKEIRGGFYGYVRDKAKQEAPPPIPDKGESPMEVKKPTEKTWFVGMKVTNNLKRMGAGGMKAARGIMEYSRKRMQWTQRDLYGAANVATIVESNTEIGQQARPGKLNIGPRRANNAERAVQTGERMRKLIERKIRPADEVEARAVEIIRTRLDEIAKDAEALGVKVSGVYGEKKWRSVKDYYPHEWLGLEELWEGEIHHNMKDVIVEKIAKEHFGPLYNDPATKAKAMETAGKYWDDFRNDLKTARYGHLEMQRILDDEFVETLRKRWEAKFPDKPFPLRLNEDISVLFRYLAGANNRIAWLQEFGKDEAYKGWMVPEKVLEWSREMENPENRKWMYNRFSDILRRGGEGKWQKLSNTIQTFQLAKMTFASLPNMWQWATNTVPNMTSKAAIEAIWDTAKFFGAAGPEAKKQAREFFSETGAGRMSADMQAAMATHPQKYAAIADIMLKGYGFTGTEFYNRLYSSFAGKRYAEHLAEKLNKSGEMGWRSPQYIAELKKLGLDAADVERLIKDGPLTKENAEKLAEAGYNMTRITQFMTDNFFLPSTWANPGVRILTQFKNFAYNQTSLLYNEPVKQAANFIKSGAKRAITGKGEVTGDLTPLLKTAAILPVAGAIVYHLKKEMYKDLGITFYEKMLAGKSEPMKWFSYIFNAGGFGIGSDIVTSVAMGKAGLTNLIGGPTMSDLAELGDAVMKTWGDLSKGGKWAAHRKESIGGYWARFGGRLSPTARVIMSQFSGEYKKVTSFNQWSRLVRDFYRKYKETYMLESPAVAEEIWQGFMETQGKDYEEATAKMGQRRKLQKPTRREIKAWWDEMGAAPSERVPMPGKKQRDLGEFYY